MPPIEACAESLDKQSVKFINESIEVTLEEDCELDDLHVPFPPKDMSHIEASAENLVTVFDFGDHSITKCKATIEPSEKVIGILGYGPIAQGIAECFQRTGHKLIVWNRTPEKLKALIKSGTEAAVSPADLVQRSDLIFSCVANVAAAKEVMRADNGILKGLEHAHSTKGYIEMTSVDPTTSCTFAEEISGKGGLYLEAQLQGTRISAQLGSLVILASGDRNLFEECESCFAAMAKNVFFLNANVGFASKANIIMNAMQGTSFAVLAEVMMVIEHAKIDVNVFIDILKMGFLRSPQLISKAIGMANKSKSVLIPARHVKNNLSMALDLGDSVSQPLPITSKALEFCKDFTQDDTYDRDLAPLYSSEGK